MSMNDFKGTLYDLLGYFAPRLIAIIGMTVAFQRIFNPQNILNAIKVEINSISAFEVFLLIIVAYIFGHAIASLSSLIIEKIVMVKIKKMSSALVSENILDKEHYKLLCTKYTEEFGTQYNDKNIRKVICFVQARQSSIYETALVFLSFYGMARNFAMLFLIFAMFELLLFFIYSAGNLYVLLFCILFFAIFFYEYIRFRKYFIDTILSGFLIAKENNV